jgi:hypothetical protein
VSGEVNKELRKLISQRLDLQKFRELDEIRLQGVYRDFEMRILSDIARVNGLELSQVSKARG